MCVCALACTRVMYINIIVYKHQQLLKREWSPKWPAGFAESSRNPALMNHPSQWGGLSHDAVAFESGRLLTHTCTNPTKLTSHYTGLGWDHF